MSYLWGDNTHILCLEDTHLLQDDEEYLKQKLNCEIILHGTKTSSRGVAVVLNNNFEYQVKNISKDNDGNMLVIDLQLLEISLRIVNIYGPNEDNPNFFLKVNEFIEDSNETYFLICVDFNLTLNPSLGCYNYININNPQSRSTVLDAISSYQLTDVFR